jgi:hypothetical protein
MKKIAIDTLKNKMTYSQYVEKVQALLAEGQTSTTGFDNSPDMLHYAQMNLQRMQRLEKTAKLTPDTLEKLSKITQPQTWLVLTEGWCGDAAHSIPIIAKMAEANPNIILHLIFRDEHLDIMDVFLTHEGRSIPKLIALDADGNIGHNWGPRPQALQDIVMQAKDIMLALPKGERKAYYEKLKTEAQMWYNNDKTLSIQRELLGTLGI